MCSFFSTEIESKDIRLMRERQNKKYSLWFHSLKIGDVLSVVYWKRCIRYGFTGICISIKNKKLLSPNSSLTLRNIIFSIGVEVILLYYYNRIFSLKVLDLNENILDTENLKHIIYEIG